MELHTQYVVNILIVSLILTSQAVIYVWIE